DLAQFAAWLEKKHRGDILVATSADIHAHLRHRFASKTRASTAARLLSSLKRFYRYALRNGKARLDPTLNIDAPKLPRGLPKTLTEADVESLLAAPDIETPLGLRDKAMLEMLYASGLRVTELVTLKSVQVSHDMG